ncbi:MFS transporter [Longispora fulva]|nr:MFS transporter [Longispora fulva]
MAHPDFRALWLGETSRGFGNAITTTVLPLVAVITLKVTPFQVGLLASLVWLPWLLIGLPAGAWVDRLPLRRLMVVCNLVSAATLASVPVAWWLDALTFGHLLVVATVIGVTAVFFSTSAQVYVPTVLAPAELMEGNAKLHGSEAATRVVGPGFGGLIAQWFGAAVGPLVDAVTFVISTVCLLLIRAREPERVEPTREESLSRRIAIGLRFVVGDPYLRPIVLYGAAVNLALNGWQAISIVFLVQTVGVNAATVGGLIAAVSLGGVLGSLVARPIGRRWGTARGLLICQFVTAPFALLMPLATKGPGLVLYTLGAMIVVAGIVACNVVLGAFRQTYCPQHMLGRVVASSMVLLHSTIPIGALLGGALGTLWGPRTTMWIMAGLIAPCWLILLAGPIRRQRDLPASYSPAAGTA